MAIPLSDDNLPRFGPPVAVPRYDRRQVAQGIVHIGVGGFHRAHQTVYTEDLFNRGEDLGWGFCGIGLRDEDAGIRDALRSQDHLYTLVERGTDGDQARIVGSIANFLFAPDEREAVLEKMTAAETKIVSMTITEGGYYVNASTGSFHDADDDITHDLRHPQTPRCWCGYLAEALARRRQRGVAPFTVLSCDNIQGNGDTARRTLLGFAELRDPALANWIRENGAFPNSMVDRITPATTDEHREMVRDRFGIDDRWPVMTEEFRQWVIEDRFVTGRPAWEKTGAQITTDVAPYETMKLRLLNAGHQALCYIGMLLGQEFAHETMADDDIRTLVIRLMDREVTPLLPPVPGIDLTDYKATLIERFANPAIRDQLSRIGIYGSSGMPKFVLPSLTQQLERGGPTRLLSFTVACWFRFLNGQDENGAELPMKDPLAPRLREIARQAGTDPAPLLALREIFPPDLAAAPAFTEQVRTFLSGFYGRGARATLREALRD